MPDGGLHEGDVAVLTLLVAVVDLLTTRWEFGAVHDGEQRGVNRADPSRVARRVWKGAGNGLWSDKDLPLSGVSRAI